MKYRIRYYPDGHEYHAFKTKPPAHTLGKEWETVDKLPKEVIEAERAVFAPKPSLAEEIELLKAEIAKLKAPIVREP